MLRGEHEVDQPFLPVQLLVCTLMPTSRMEQAASLSKSKAPDRAYDTVFPAAKGLLPNTPLGSSMPLLLFIV